MSQPPTVTVLMSVFNDAAFLPEAVESILAQTFTDFEFLIIDDGSSDETSVVLTRFRDSRIRIIRNPQNLGLTRSLAHGVISAKGRYLARMDADDVAYPHRLHAQVEFLGRHRDVALLGGACDVINEKARRVGRWYRPERDLDIRWTSLLANPFIHSTVMVRREVLTEHKLNYDPEFRTAQDYDLWTRVLNCGEGANLGQPLIRYRVRTGVTRMYRASQLSYASEIAARTARTEAPGVIVKPDQIRGLWKACFREGESDKVQDSWISLSLFYRQLFLHFAAKRDHQPAAPLRRLRRRQSAEIIRSMVRHRFPKGWRNLLVTILQEDPGLPVWCGLKLMANGARRLGGNAFGSPACWSTPVTP